MKQKKITQFDFEYQTPIIEFLQVVCTGGPTGDSWPENPWGKSARDGGEDLDKGYYDEEYYDEDAYGDY